MTITRTRDDGSKDSSKRSWPTNGGITEPGGASGGIVSMIETHMAPGEWLVTYLQNGKQGATMHKVISKDGKTMRQTIRGFDAEGKPFEQLQVFDRQ